MVEEAFGAAILRLNVSSSSRDNMSTISPTDFDSLEIQQQYNDINNRWDLAAEADWDNENGSARLFERSRIKALAGHTPLLPGIKVELCNLPRATLSRELLMV
ncbi:Spectrin beta chain, non-erythrocytic 1 [Liparis tanakae]|uniref:Spectrin beta chain, non-erythrocytic 1 n=1 Tax=Liparis tanakae TaxID=230148 RepID=A0A4Z2I349_9TELE|nr:Spectrin beta chain, non-erythrocytic 1 [Liparis tanakae]